MMMMMMMKSRLTRNNIVDSVTYHHHWMIEDSCESDDSFEVQHKSSSLTRRPRKQHQHQLISTTSKSRLQQKAGSWQKEGKKYSPSYSKETTTAVVDSFEDGCKGKAKPMNGKKDEYENESGNESMGQKERD
jgi:hypothetical protein